MRGGARIARLVIWLGLLAGCLVLPAAAGARSLYVAQHGDNQSNFTGIFEMVIGADGTLTYPGGGFGFFGVGYAGTAMTPDGHYMLSAGAFSSSLTREIHISNGSISDYGSSGPNTLSNPKGVVASPNGGYAYVANGGDDTVSAFTLSTSPSSTGPILINRYPTGGGAYGAAMTPGGGFLYVANKTSDNVSGYSVAADGALTHIAEFALPSGLPGAGAPTGLAVSPDGKYLFAADDAQPDISVWSIAPSGALSPVGNYAATISSLGGLAMSPDGHHLFAAQDSGGTGVVAFNVGADGSLSQAGAAVPTGGQPSDGPGIEVTPDGRFLYVTTETTNIGQVAGYAVRPDGSLDPLGGSPWYTGQSEPRFQSLVIVPDQSPTANFTASVNGAQAAFNGSGSSDSDGSVARYDWSFGDGETVVDGGPTPTHTYTSPGTYTATLTETDDEGCSTQLVYTGQTASCSGSTPATQQITIGPAGSLSVALGGAQKQKLSRKGIAVRLECGGSACGVTVAAKVAVPRSAFTKKRVTIAANPASTLLPAARPSTLQMKFKGTGYRKLHRALTHGAKLTAKVSASAKAGNFSSTAKRSVKLAAGNRHAHR